MKLSLVIPAKDVNDLKLKELLKSIDGQDFPKDEMETLVITEGTSESAKAIGIRRAKGEVIGILASDNFLPFDTFLKKAIEPFPVVDASWPMRYHYSRQDDVLNRYFALIGGNDPLCYYMNKNDKESYLENLDTYEEWDQYDGSRRNAYSSIGDNGFFIKKSLIEKTDLNNYYHIDNAWEALDGKVVSGLMFSIWHKTGGNIFKFFAKRYRYGLQHAFNSNRRWHLVDFSKPQDIRRLIWFVLATVTVIQPLSLSIRGWLKIRDKAWFLHPIVCFLTVGTYTALMIHLGIRNLYQSLFAPMVAQRA